MRRHPKRTTWRWGIGALTVVLVAAGCTSKGHVTDASSSPSGSHAKGVPEGCDSWAKAPAKDGIEVSAARAEYDKKRVDTGPVIFEATLTDTGDLAAVDTEVTYRFYIKGKNVTDQLGKDFTKDYAPLTVALMLPRDPGDGKRIDYPRGGEVKGPSAWDGRQITLKVTTKVGSWCKPSPLKSKGSTHE
ncbi:MAG TPA: hypothetical protein VE172_23955 [Stackebrandtia sp.]|jgi:hypothetical protein|uniref:hypothetical protein n=1 Tax=Stackebrandtia sp. TaxID=2023065 RepID=UPI002D6278CB|nr:hypothetical protein [Stackebrandtia sp.]HZE41865.1 hypothetical protein [Stackebrandtia sp.]